MFKLGSDMSVRDRLHREGSADDRKYDGLSSNSDREKSSGFIYILLRESSFLCVGLASLSFLKNETSIGFNISFVMAVLLGVGSRFLMSFFINKTCNSGNFYYRGIVFLLLSAVPFTIIFMLIFSIFNVNSFFGTVTTIGISLLVSTLLENRLFESLR